MKQTFRPLHVLWENWEQKTGKMSRLFKIFSKFSFWFFLFILVNHMNTLEHFLIIKTQRLIDNVVRIEFSRM